MDTSYPLMLDWELEYWWTVTPYNFRGDASPVEEWTFTTRQNPTVTLPHDFDFTGEATGGMPTDWERTHTNWSLMASNNAGGTAPELRMHWSPSVVDAVRAITAPLLGDNENGYRGRFKHNYTYHADGPILKVEISTDKINWIPLWTTIPTATIPAVEVELENNLTDYVGETPFYLAWTLDGNSYNTNGWYVDDISFIRILSGPPAAPILTYPDDGATGLPIDNIILSWQPNLNEGGDPSFYEVNLSKSIDGIFSEYSAIEVFDGITTCNPLTDGTGEIEFDYEETWYWTVTAYIIDGEAIIGSESAEIRSFTIEKDPTVDEFPWCEDFEDVPTTGFPPSGWTVHNIDGAGKTWESNTTYNHTPGGLYSAMHNYASVDDEGWMITPPITLPAEGAYELTFWHYNSFPTWYDYNAVMVTTGDPDPVNGTWIELWSPDSVEQIWKQESLPLIDYLNETIYLAFVYEGNNAHAWYVDDVCVKKVFVHDAAATAITAPERQVVDLDDGDFDIKVKVENLGLYPASFYVYMTYGSTYRVRDVNNLPPNESTTVTFKNIEPVMGLNVATFTTMLTGDENPENDEFHALLYGAPLDKTAYADVLFSIDTGATPTGLASLNLSDPKTITPLSAPNLMTEKLYAADWIDGAWWGAETLNDWWHIKIPDGTMTSHGTHGLQLGGVAWDPYNDIVYACTGTELYILDKETGEPTLQGDLSWWLFGDPLPEEGTLVGIAFDNASRTLYGLDVGYDAIFKINPNTLECSALGYTLGWDIHYAQDMAFDQDTGLLYIAACTQTDGMLLLVNTSYEHIYDDEPNSYMGEGYLIGSFINEAELDGFVIPYGIPVITPELSVALDGTLNWNDVGTPYYNIYRSADPYSGYSFVASTPNTYWRDPQFELNEKMFYRVTSADQERAGVQHTTTIFNNIYNLKKENIMTPERYMQKPGYSRPLIEDRTGKKVK